MQTNPVHQNEYRNLPISALKESPTNPRRRFNNETLKELAASFKSQGILQPLVVRELAKDLFEVVAGARRLRAARIAELGSVPVRVVQLTDAAAIEAQVVENLQREDIHPLEEALGFRSLLDLNNSPYNIAGLAAKTGKSEAYVLGRIKLTDLIPAIAEAFLSDQIAIGHALLVAKLPKAQQPEAFKAAFRQTWTTEGNKPVLVPVKELAGWIESNILLELAAAPFSKEDAALVQGTGSCAHCPKRTGYNALLFSEVRKDSCTDPQCFRSKLDAHIAKTIEAKPQLVQISSAWTNREGKPLGHNRYVELQLKSKKSRSKNDSSAAWQKPCDKMAEAILVDGGKRGHLLKICADQNCRIHHGNRPSPQETERERRNHRQRIEREKQAITVRHRTLAAILKNVTSPLKKADLRMIALKLLSGMPSHLITRLAQRLRPAAKNAEQPEAAIQKLIETFDDDRLNKFLLECVLLESAYHIPFSKERDALLATAKRYRINTDNIADAVKKEFAAKGKKAEAKETMKEGKRSKK